jgi:SAM-dependent methyltransferase
MAERCGLRVEKTEGEGTQYHWLWCVNPVPSNSRRKEKEEMSSAPTNTAEVQRRMRDDWDARARENAFYYIASSRDDWTNDEFFASGEESVRVLAGEDLDAICRGKSPAKMRMLEIGCGAGRMTRAFSKIFGEVHGVDVSGEMVAKARRLLADRLNAFVHHNSGSDLRVLGDLKLDFAFSFIVFQHIPSKEVVENYVRETARRLKAGGVFKFQIQGAATAEGQEADTWVGVSYSPAEAQAMVERCGLRIDKTDGEGTQYFWLWCSKPTLWETWKRAWRRNEWFEGLRLRRA